MNLIQGRKILIILSCFVFVMGMLLHAFEIEGTERRPIKFQALNFVPNLGQWDDPSSYHVNLVDAKLFVEPHQLSFVLINAADHLHGSHKFIGKDEHAHEVEHYAYRMKFVNTSPKTTIIPSDKKDPYHNYFLGSDTSRWKSNVPIYGSLLHKSLYEGIDVQTYLKDGIFKYDFLIKAGTDPSIIEIEYEGIEHINIEDGKLHLKTPKFEIIEEIPLAYQDMYGKRNFVEVSYQLVNGRAKLKIGDYNPDFDLVIDPEIVFCSFTGSLGDNWGVCATFDDLGHGYIGGTVYDTGYPLTTGALDPVFGGPVEVGVSKFNPAGTNLIFSTYLGGNATEAPHSMVVNSNYDLLVLGTTSSLDFPVTANAYDRTFNGGITTVFSQNEYINGTDIFIARINADGTNLSASTYVGGSNNDGFNEPLSLVRNYGDALRGEIFVDESDNVYVASMSSSTDFPTTVGAWDRSYGGNQDAVVFKFNTDLNNLIFSTYYGGSGSDASYSMKLNDAGTIYFSGGTESSDIDGMNGLHTSARGDVDGFLAALSNSGANITSATYLGTGDVDQAYFIEIGPDGDIYVLGDSRGGNYPVTAGAYNNPNSGQFIHKLNPQLNNTIFSTVYGNGSRYRTLSLSAFMVDDCNRIYTSGWGGQVNAEPGRPVYYTDNFPVTADALQPTTDGSDFHFMVLGPNAEFLEYATFFGSGSLSEHVDGGTSRFDRRGIIYQGICAGCSGSSDFPTTNGAYAQTNGSRNCNMALVKFDFILSRIEVEILGDPDIVLCEGEPFEFISAAKGRVKEVEWFLDGTLINTDSIIRLELDPGNYTLMLVGEGELDCIEPDTAYVTIDVLENIDANNDYILKCADVIQNLQARTDSDVTDYLWNTGSTNGSIDIYNAGYYIVSYISTEFCYAPDTFEIEVFEEFLSASDVKACESSPPTIASTFPSDTDTYVWSTGASTPSIVADQSGIYYVRSVIAGDCDYIDTFHVELYPQKPPSRTDISYCLGKYITIGTSDDRTDVTYSWNDGLVNTPTREVSDTGLFIVTATHAEFCPVIDSFYLSYSEPFPAFIDSISICDNELYPLIAPSHELPAISFEWSTGATDSIIYVNQTGWYRVISDVDQFCPYVDSIFISVDEFIDEEDFYVPNAFSPNDDGVNDVFLAYKGSYVEVLKYRLLVFDRWGDKIYESRSFEQGWQGFYHNQEVASLDVMSYVIEMTVMSCGGIEREVKLHGDVTPMR